MIIDLLTQNPNIIRCSAYDDISKSMLSSNYTIKTDSDILSWRLTSESVSSVTFTIISDQTRLLKEVIYDLKGGITTMPNSGVTIMHSIDYINWYALDKFYDTGATNITDQEIYTKRDNTYYYIDADNDIDYEGNEHAGLLERLKYAFKKRNTYTGNSEYIYDSLEFKYLQITFTGIKPTIDNPVFLNSLNVYIDDTFSYNSLTNNILEIKSDIFTPQTIFESETFLPDSIKKFMMMLEDKNNDITTNLLRSSLYIGQFQTKSSLNGQGIDFDAIEYNLVVY